MVQSTKHILRAVCMVLNYILLSATLRMVVAGELGEFLFQDLPGFIIWVLGL